MKEGEGVARVVQWAGWPGGPWTKDMDIGGGKSWDVGEAKLFWLYSNQNSKQPSGSCMGAAGGPR